MANLPLRCLAPALLVCAALSATAAPEPASLDTRVLIDISGSMKKTDPENLRAPALRLLADLLPEGSRAGVWTFGRYVNMQVPHARVDRDWRDSAIRGADAIHSRGLYTNIEEALRGATQSWRTPPGEESRSLILLTDGVVDVSRDPAESAASRARILDASVARLREQGVELLTIALSQDADQELLRALAHATGGWYELAGDADQLQRAFLRAFEKVSPPDTLPLDDNRFHVDPSIRELTLLVFRKPGAAPLEIAPPEAAPFSMQDAPSGVSWRADAGYDLVTVPAPASGEWRVLGEVDPDNRVMVVTDLRLQTSPLPNQVSPGAGLRIDAQLSERDQPIVRADFTRLVNMFVEHLRPDGEIDAYRMTPGAEGVFGIDLEGLTQDGEHRLILTASSDTFVRERTHSLQVALPVQVELEEAPGNGRSLRVTARGEYLHPGSAQVAGRLVDPSGNVTALALAGEVPGVWEADLGPLEAPGDYRLELTVSGRSPAGLAVSVEIPPLSLPGAPSAAEPAPAVVQAPPAASVPDWGRIAWQVALANAVALAIIAAVAFWRRRRARAAELQLLEPVT